MKLFFLSLVIFLSISVSVSSQIIPPKREHRGAWVASVGNIDWPSARYATSGQQIKDLVEHFEKLKSAGFNAVFFHVRTECDALYNSGVEPWAYWLTGEQGTAPSPLYDPLEFAIDEAHSRGMELHAWFNPYRVQADTGNYIRSINHVSKTHPEWLLKFGKYVMLDPGNPQVKDYIFKVVTEVVTKYDVDGIHFDDYFYPYSPKVSNEDSLSFIKYNNGIKNIDDWRRWNINDLMERLYNMIKATKPWVKFGISPFGVVENKYTGTKALNSYSEIYCDPLTWLRDKTVDYITPQIYWEIGHDRADYSKILPWWTTVLNGRHLYVGLFSSRLMADNFKGDKNQLFNQIKMNRSYENCGGQVLFSSKSVTNNYSGLMDSLKNVYFKYPALPPVMPWLDSINPLQPKNLKINSNDDWIRLSWEQPEPASDGDIAKYYVIYRFIEGEVYNFEDPRNILVIQASDRLNYRIKRDNTGIRYFFVVTALDKLFNESTASNQVTN